jgi:outer membrane protein TolC
MLLRIIVALLIVGLWTGWTSAQAPPGSGDVAAPSPAEPEGAAGEGADPAAGRMPDSLDGMLAIALRSNPEVLQAEAKLNRAQADLNQARLKVIREVITAFHERKKLEESTDVQLNQVERMQKMVETGQAPTESAGQARLQLTEARARLAQIEAQIRYMMGNEGGAGLGKKKMPPPPMAPSGALGMLAKPTEPHPGPPVPERLEQVLKERISLSMPAGSTLRQICDWPRKTLRQTLVIDESLNDRLEQPLQEPLELRDIPLRDALLAIADIFKVCFVLRDYGLLMVAPEQAPTYSSPTIPSASATG